MVPIKTKHIKIRGKTWTVELLTSEAFRNEDAAYTDAAKKTMSFQPGHTDIETIRHEIFHAYMAESYLKDSDLDRDSLEEAAANVVGDFLPQMNRHANAIWKVLNNG